MQMSHGLHSIVTLCKSSFHGYGLKKNINGDFSASDGHFSASDGHCSASDGHCSASDGHCSAS